MDREFMRAPLRRAVFLDKDGTLVPDVPYNVDPSRVQLSPHVAGTLRKLQNSGYIFVVVTNQSGVARRYFSENALEGALERLRTMLQRVGVRVEAFYWCPHYPPVSGPCDCRKPESGLLLRAASDLGIDLANSWMIGDILDDVEAGTRAGCRTILLDNGNEKEWRLAGNRIPTSTISDFAEAYDVIKDHQPRPLATKR